MGLSRIDARRPRQDLRAVTGGIGHGLRSLRHRRPRTLRRVRDVGGRFSHLKIRPSGACVFVRNRRVVSGMILQLLVPMYAMLHQRERRRVRSLTLRSVRLRGRLADCRQDRMNIRIIVRQGDFCGGSPLCRVVQESVRGFLGVVH